MSPGRGRRCCIISVLTRLIAQEGSLPLLIHPPYLEAVCPLQLQDAPCCSDKWRTPDIVTTIAAKPSSAERRRFMVTISVYSTCHQIVCFEAMEGVHSLHRSALNHLYSVPGVGTLWVLSCLYSRVLRSSCCNLYGFCDLVACNLVTDIILAYARGREYETHSRGRLFWRFPTTKHINVTAQTCVMEVLLRLSVGYSLPETFSNFLHNSLPDSIVIEMDHDILSVLERLIIIILFRTVNAWRIVEKRC